MANDIFHYWLPIISEVLPPSLLEQVKKFEGDYEWLQELLREFWVIIDTSEQVRERPGDYQEQTAFSSGKKKNHTLKNQLIVLPEGKDIVDLLPGVPDPKSDINLLRERLRHEVRANIAMVVGQIKYSRPILAKLVQKGKLKVVGARDDLDNGVIEMIS